MKQHLFFAQKAFIVHEERLLLVRKSSDDPHNPGLWEVPGGRMDFGEQIDEHLAREVREEVGIEVVAGEPFHAWSWRLEHARDGELWDYQIVALARLCSAVTSNLDVSGQVEEDYLSEALWAPLGDLDTYEFIANMAPVLASFKTRLQL